MKPGERLSDYLARHRDREVPESTVQSIRQSLFNALVTLDSVGLAHGDICPDTVFMRHDGPCMLTDFAMARHDFFEKNGHLARSLRPGYSPVELHGARHDQGPWTDIYCAGATLYRCVTGIDR